MKAPPRAFVVEPTKFDISLAEEFGEVTYIFGPDDRRLSIWDPDFTRQVVDRLVLELEYDPGRDHFVIAGHMVTLTFVVAALVRYVGPFKALLYSAVEQKYVSRKIGGASADARRDDDPVQSSPVY